MRNYFLFFREEKKSAPSTMNIAVLGLHFFFIPTLHRDWPAFELLRVNNPQNLLVVLSRDEVDSVLSTVRQAMRVRRLQLLLGAKIPRRPSVHSKNGEAQRVPSLPHGGALHCAQALEPRV